MSTYLCVDVFRVLCLARTASVAKVCVLEGSVLQRVFGKDICQPAVFRTVASFRRPLTSRLGAEGPGMLFILESFDL